jgi:hypothetical protein
MTIYIYLQVVIKSPGTARHMSHLGRLRGILDGMNKAELMDLVEALALDEGVSGVSHNLILQLSADMKGVSTQEFTCGSSQFLNIPPFVS